MMHLASLPMRISGLSAVGSAIRSDTSHGWWSRTGVGGAMYQSGVAVFEAGLLVRGTLGAAAERTGAAAADRARGDSVYLTWTRPIGTLSRKTPLARSSSNAFLTKALFRSKPPPGRVHSHCSACHARARGPSQRSSSARTRRYAAVLSALSSPRWP